MIWNDAVGWSEMWRIVRNWLTEKIPVCFTNITQD
jgi:hypothetical protein